MSKKSKIPTVAEIIERCGGAPRISAAISATGDGEITTDAVYKWRRVGIQDRHWPVLMRLTPLTADELLNANIAVRRDAAAKKAQAA